MRAQAELGGIGLADKNGTGVAQPLDHQGIGRRHKILQKGRALRGADPFDRLQIFHGMGKAVQRSHGLSLRQLAIALAGLRHEGVAILKGDDGVDPGIDEPRCDRDRHS